MIFKILHVISVTFGLICVEFGLMVWFKGDDCDYVIFLYINAKVSVEKFNKERNCPGNLKFKAEFVL